MPQLEKPRYDLYGLPCSPYAERELDPLQCGTDENLLLELEGFVELSNIKDALQAAVTSQKPAFFLVIGTENSGRASLANYIIYRYRELRAEQLGQDLTKNFVAYRPERSKLNFSSSDLLQETLFWLRARAPKLHLDLTDPDLTAQIERLSKGEIKNLFDLQYVATLIGEAYAVKKAGFGIHYYRVVSPEMLSWAPTVFEDTETVVVLSVDDYKHGVTVKLTELDREAFRQRGLVIELSHLTANQIAMLACGRWNGRNPCPFDQNGVTAAFKDSRHSVGNALWFLHGLLRQRLREYHDEEPWPDATGLRLDQVWLADAIESAQFWMNASSQSLERHDG